MKVSILNYTCTTRPSAHLEIDHFLSWLYIPDFRMFCISMYSEGINTNYTCTIRPIIIRLKVYESFYHGYINRISVSFVFPLSSDVNNESASLVYRNLLGNTKHTEILYL